MALVALLCAPGLLGQSNNLIAQLLPSDSHIDIGLPQPKRKPLSDGVDQFPATIPMSLSEYQAAAIISQAALSAVSLSSEA